jgi:hypothetical protein
MTAVLLFSAAAYGDHESGQLKTSKEDFHEAGNADVSVSTNPITADDVISRRGTAKFVGLNICGFDFGW